MPRVAVAVSDTSNAFAVINFTTPGSPSIAYFVHRCSSRGCRIALGESNAFVGGTLAGQVLLVDVSNPWRSL